MRRIVCCSAVRVINLRASTLPKQSYLNSRIMSSLNIYMYQYPTYELFNVMMGIGKVLNSTFWFKCICVDGLLWTDKHESCQEWSGCQVFLSLLFLGIGHVVWRHHPFGTILYSKFLFVGKADYVPLCRFRKKVMLTPLKSYCSLANCKFLKMKLLVHFCTSIHSISTSRTSDNSWILRYYCLWISVSRTSGNLWTLHYHGFVE